MSPLFISLLMAAGFAAFGVMAWRKLAIVAALAPDNRFDRLGERTMRLLKMGIGQSRMLTGDFRPGLMHAVIFVGFMTLLVRKLHLIVIGYWPEAVIPGAFGAGLLNGWSSSGKRPLFKIVTGVSTGALMAPFS